MKASRLVVICLFAGGLAGLTGGRVLAQSPVELQREIDDLRDVQSILSKPGTVILPIAGGGLRTFDRDDYSQLMGSWVSQGEMSPEDVKRLVYLSAGITKIAREVVAKELGEKEQALARLRRGDWVPYEGELTGTFKADCATATGSGPQSGIATFQLEESGSVASRFQGWGIGTIALDGSAAGWATIEKLHARWWGRFRRIGGTIHGSGSISKRDGETYGCTGTWSVP